MGRKQLEAPMNYLLVSILPNVCLMNYILCVFSGIRINLCGKTDYIFHLSGALFVQGKSFV